MSSYEFQLSMWPAQRDQRREMNDAFGTPRTVEHFAYFRRRRHAKDATAELTAAGFAVSLGRRRFTTILQATRSEPLGDDEVSRFLKEVVDIVERNGGDYDGWGATVEAQPTA